MLTQQSFVEKYGDPAKFSFRSQCYDSGKPTTVCVCSRRIRFCFILYSPTDQKVTIGSCCFKLFKDTRLAPVLEASQLLLLNGVFETMKATRKAQEQAALKESKAGWVKLRKEALQRLRAYRKASGKNWLPEALFDLKVALDAPEPQHRQVKSAARWFRAKTSYLQKKLAATTAAQGNIAHEKVADHQG